jgi:molecular chaperone DnaK (HSP70)
MKVGIAVGIISALAVTQTVYAENVSVQINNSVNSSTTTVTNNSNTRVEITQNGETKVFESTGEGIDYKSPDGSTTVKINGNGKEAQSEVDKNTQDTVNKVKEEVKGAVENSKKEIEQTIQKNREDTEKIVADEVETRTQRIFTIIKDFFVNLLPK